MSNLPTREKDTKGVKETKEKAVKVRVFTLAKELGVESKTLLDYCKELGFANVTNQLNGLEPHQVEALRERVKKGPKRPPSTTPKPSVEPTIPPTIPPVGSKVLNLPRAKPGGRKLPTTTGPVTPPATSTPAPPTVTSPTPSDAILPAAPTTTTSTPNTVSTTPSTPPPSPVGGVPSPTAPATTPVNGLTKASGLTKEEAPTTGAPPGQTLISPSTTLSAATTEEPSAATKVTLPSPAAGEPPPPTPIESGSPRTPTPSAPSSLPRVPAPQPAATASAGVVTPPAQPTPSASSAPPSGSTQQPSRGSGPANSQPPASAVPAVAGTIPTSVVPPVIPPASGAIRNLNIPPAGRPPTLQPPRPSGPRSEPRTTSGSSPSREAAAAPRSAYPGAPTVSPPPSSPPSSGSKSPPPSPTAPTPPVTSPGGGTPASRRAEVLNRPPQPPPPKIIAPQRSPGTSSPTGKAGGTPTQRPPAPPKPTPGQPMKLTEEMIRRLREASARGQRLNLQDLARPQPPAPSPSGRAESGRLPSRPSSRGPAVLDEEEEERARKKSGGLIGREARQKGRGDRSRDIDEHAVILGPGGKVDIIEEQWGSRRGPRAARLLKARREQEQRKIEGPVEVTLPLTVRSFSEAIGMKLNEVIQRLLKETGQLYAANAVVDFDTAALIAMEKNIELIAKQPETKEDQLLRRYREMLENIDPSRLKPRPPIVTIMGHVDHGKTTLLDKIRQMFGLQSDVAASEAGGITQVLRAWSVKREVLIEKDGQEVTEERYITFLDTPGHEAFTKMRARGANVTDIAVIVVAATDGVMPQTQEAISHARAANVKIIVAINKIDLPNANVERTRRQLYQEGLIPDNMGGDVLFVETSAVTGQGVADLLDAIILVAEVEQWKADPDRPAAGTCLEAYMSADEGVTATLLIQQGTLHRGDIVLCGSAYGRVRAMYNDLGQPITQAGPSMPVRITGLNRVPNADDPFYVTEDLSEAREIAEAREQKEREASLTRFVAPRDLSELTAAQSKAQVTELKVILKADARGSIEAIRKELEKLVHEEARVRILHAAVGAITETDVQLALTSPHDTLILGFNVTADDAALKLAEERGISLREYDIIYKLTEDVKAALEGRLKPVEEIVHLGRAVVRQVFKLGKVGTVAGCYVTSGVIERNAHVRVIRNGVVVYPPPDKVATLESLKRFKDDVREVREGFECGMKIGGYDDIKVDDVIEAYKVEVRQRRL